MYRLLWCAIKMEIEDQPILIKLTSSAGAGSDELQKVYMPY